MTTDCSFHWPDIGRVAGPCIRPGGTALTGRALDACGLAPGAHVADIGCGAGGTLEHLERAGAFRTVGVDCSETLLREALPRLAEGRLAGGLAEALPFKAAASTPSSASASFPLSVKGRLPSASSAGS